MSQHPPSSEALSEAYSLPNYEDPEATRPHDELSPMSMPRSSTASAQRSEARLDPLVEVWAWLSEELRDSNHTDPCATAQLAEVLALSGHANAARDAARKAFEMSPNRVAFARQFRALAHPHERAAVALAEATASANVSHREHAYAHAWLSAYVAQAPSPKPLEASHLSAWLGACGGTPSSADASDDIMLAVDYMTQMQSGTWETSYPAPAVLTSGLSRDPQKLDASLQRLIDVCAHTPELQPAVPWLRIWAGQAEARASSNANTMRDPELMALLALEGAGEVALAAWLRKEFSQADANEPHDAPADAESMVAGIFGQPDSSPEASKIMRKLRALIAPTDKRLRALADGEGLQDSERQELQEILRQRDLLSLSGNAHAEHLQGLRARILEAPSVNALNVWFAPTWSQEEQAKQGRAEALASLQRLAPWVVADAKDWSAQVSALAEHSADEHGATESLRALFALDDVEVHDPAIRALRDSILDAHGALHVPGFEVPDAETHAQRWVARERAQSWSADERGLWAERALGLAPNSPWVQRYAEEIRRLDGQDLYAQLTPETAAAEAERQGDLQEALRLTLAMMPGAQETAKQRVLYTNLARLYAATGDLDKAKACLQEIAKRT